MNVQRVPAYLDSGKLKIEVGTALVDLDMGCATVTVTNVDVFEKVFGKDVVGVSVTPSIDPTQLCAEHKPVQHRDFKPPWCNKCGLTAGYEFPTGRLDRPREDSDSESQHDFTD